MDTNYTLKRIRDILDERNLSLYKLAKKSNIPYSSLNSLFQKNNQPTISTLEKICLGLGISMSDFFSDKPVSQDWILDASEDDIQMLISIHKMPKEHQVIIYKFVEMMSQHYSSDS